MGLDIFVCLNNDSGLPASSVSGPSAYSAEVITPGRVSVDPLSIGWLEPADHWINQTS